MAFFKVKMIQPDRLFQALSLFRRRRFTECVQITTEILQENPNDQVDSANE